jgi:hypothetical protein
VHDALATLPWVEKDSVKVNFSQKLATFNVTDPKKFNLEQAQGALSEAGSNYKASVVQTGSAIPTAPPKDKPAAGT